MKKGFYKSSKVQVSDNYGGAVYSLDGYYYISYVDPKNVFFILSTSKGKPKLSVLLNSPVMQEIKGEILRDEDGQLEISFYNPNLKMKEIFKGWEENDKLYLKGYRQDAPKDIWLEDVFEYIGTGE